MGRYLLRRLAISVPVLFGITLVTFVIINMAPGDPVAALIDPESISALGPEWFEEQKKALGLDQPVGADDDFFSLGGDSLLAVHLLLGMRERFGRDPGLGALFDRPRVADLAALIDSEGRLVGIGSLTVGDAAAKDVASPGNMFVPIDALRPILGDLLTRGRREAPGHPWVGVYAQEGETQGLVAYSEKK